MSNSLVYVVVPEDTRQHILNFFEEVKKEYDSLKKELKTFIYTKRFLLIFSEDIIDKVKISEKYKFFDDYFDVFEWCVGGFSLSVKWKYNKLDKLCDLLKTNNEVYLNSDLSYIYFLITEQYEKQN